MAVRSARVFETSRSVFVMRDDEVISVGRARKRLNAITLYDRDTSSCCGNSHDVLSLLLMLHVKGLCCYNYYSMLRKFMFRACARKSESECAI